MNNKHYRDLNEFLEDHINLQGRSKDKSRIDLILEEKLRFRG
jgi:hypothetical protein